MPLIIPKAHAKLSLEHIARIPNIINKIDVIFSHPESKNLISRYEDISIEKCVLAQINLGVKNAEITNINPDITLFVNNFQNLQGELVFLDSINEFKGKIPKFEKSEKFLCMQELFCVSVCTDFILHFWLYL